MRTAVPRSPGHRVEQIIGRRLPALILAAILAVLLAGAPAARAAGAAQAGDPAGEPADETDGNGTGRGEEDRPAGTPARPAGESPEIFIPSEEISEDFAVPYPVDI